MMTVPQTQLREELLSRRARLDAVRAAGVAVPVGDLLAEVDAALARLEAGTFGLCETCHDPIEADRLTADPLVRFCLDHLTPGQRLHLERDLELARDIQQALLPTTDVSLSGWQVHYAYRPLGTVSGDYCDVIAPSAGSQWIAVGDVSGKGVSASILMSNLHALFRSLSTSGVAFPEVVPRVNRIFCESTLPSSFATLVFCRLDPAGGLEICNAGHCPPVIVRRDGVESIAPTGTAIGLFGDGHFASVQRTLAPGDLLVIYTDGLTETFDASGVEYGAERLERLLPTLAGAHPRDVSRASLRDLDTFRGRAPRQDDLALMVVRRTQES